MQTIARALIVSLSAATLGLVPAARADDAPLKFDGRGSKRQAWDAMQYKPFDSALWGTLTGWSDEQPFSAEAIKSKPVLIVTWASWFRPSHNGLKVAQEVASKYESLGLLVLAVHNQRGFEKAKQTLEDNKVVLKYAHDPKGEFFGGLKIEGAGPDYFLIDRAGRVRYAGVARESLDAAAAILAKETPAEAAKAQPPSLGDGKGGKPGTDGASAPAKLPAAAYADVQWPKVNSSPGPASNFQGKPFPGKLSKAKYLDLVPNLENKIVVLDFWATWCAPCRESIPHLAKLAKEHSKDVVVIGLSDEDEKVVRKFLAKSKHEYYQGLDTAGGMSTAMGIQGIPHVVVLSSDGVVRWQGNPLDVQTLRDTVKTLVKVDPGVAQARK